LYFNLQSILKRSAILHKIVFCPAKRAIPTTVQCSEFSFLKRATINRKLDIIQHRDKPTRKSDLSPDHASHQFGPRIANLSGHSFIPSEVSLLEKGLKHIPNVPVSDKD
jgi:hypothetical protein